MNENKLKMRIETLKEMDRIICNEIGDDYVWGMWITFGVPDCADITDFEFIAEDEKSYAETTSLFFELAGE